MRRIVMLAYEGAQILDITGPLEVFAAASRVLAEESAEGAVSGGYRSEIAAVASGPIRMSGGVEIVARQSLAESCGDARPVDTLMVPGGMGTRRALENPDHIAWIRTLAPRARRVASVCTGTFLLAEAGLLEGRSVTTHWMNCDDLRKYYPGLRVEPEPIFIKDGDIYTSAGVTAGMDLALALVEEDFGRQVALRVAQLLVMFLKRPGGQSQFSAQLSAQLAERDCLRELQSYIIENPAADLCVESLAARSAMSPRNFARVFSAEVGSTPARFVETARVEAARRRLEESRGGIEVIAKACGFGSGETMRRAFVRNLHVAPAEYRERFRGVVTVQSNLRRRQHERA
ncbi:MAG: GlxA family transcriptional regulator [Deltaproteobacteria bacterium]|nr:GlxA family transcriptional regulator [Deltaproteobacteria bacterium]